MKRFSLRVALGTAAALTLTATSAVLADWYCNTGFFPVCTAFVDNFTDPARDPFWSYLFSGTGPISEESGGVLRMTIPDSTNPGTATAVGTSYVARCTLRGNFDIDVAYNLETVPINPARGWGVFLGVDVPTQNKAYVTARSYDPTLGHLYSGVLGYRLTSATSGRLRLQRIGGDLRGYYSEDVNVAPGAGFGTAVGTGDGPVTVFLHAQQDANVLPLENMQITFDGFNATADFIECAFDAVCGDGNPLGEQCDDGNEVGNDDCCACLLTTPDPLPPPPDMSGEWQMTVNCGDQAATIVRPVTVAHVPGESNATVNTNTCGVVTYEAQSISVASCSPTSHVAEICGDQFAYRPPAEDLLLSSPLSGPSGCQNLAQVTSGTPRYRGSIAADGSNRGVLIHGTFKTDDLALFNAGETTPCASLGGVPVECTLQMGRNVATPQAPMAEPVPGVTLSFDSLTEPVEVLVVPQSAPAATIPSGFASLGNAYFDISTASGAFSGSITICLPFSYANPSDLKIGHQEGSAFDVLDVVVDNDNSRVCAVVDHFSQFTVLAVSVCGNGNLEPGEECDDGNLVDEDCCRNDCSIVVGACEDDGDVCTADVCDAGLCTHVIPTTPCDTALDNKGALSIQRSEDGSKNGVTWKWRSSDAFDVASFGPTDGTTDLSLCVYDGLGSVLGARIPALGECAGAACWQVDSGRGKASYSSTDSLPDGIRKFSAKSGAEGKGKIVLKGKGANLVLPGLDLQMPVRARLSTSNGRECWETSFSVPSNVKLNNGEKFKARSD